MRRVRSAYLNSPPVSSASCFGTAGCQAELTSALGTAATRSGKMGKPVRWQALQPDGVDAACSQASAYRSILLSKVMARGFLVFALSGYSVIIKLLLFKLLLYRLRQGLQAVG